MVYRILKSKQKNWAEETKRNSQKRQQSGEKGALEKEHHNHEKELGKFVLF